MDHRYLLHMWINNTTGDKSVCDTIINSACSVCADPLLLETMSQLVHDVHCPPPEEEEEEEYEPDNDDDLFDYG